MQNLRLTLIYIATFLRRRKKLFLAGIIAFLVLIYLIIFLNSKYTQSQVTEGVVGTYEENNLPEVVTSLLSSKFVTIDEKGLPRGGIAKSWEVNEQGNEYTFKLNENLRWLDGTPIRAQEVSLRVPEVKVEVIDDLTIKFKLTDAFSPFPSLLTVPVFKKDSLVGTGPYKVGSILKDGIFIKRITLIPIDKSLPKVVVRFYPNEKIAKNALKLGEVQLVLGINDFSGLQASKFGNFSKTNFNQLVTVFYNTKDPILSDENFRLALSYGAPKFPNEIEAQTSIPSTSWAFNVNVKDFLDNPDQAKNYLSKVQNGKSETITLTATSTLKEVGEKVVKEWNKNGIKAVLRVESGIPQNFQALLITQNIPSDPDQYSLWHSTQTATNISKFSSPRVDKDLEDGRKISDLETRKKNYQDFQKVLLDHAPATFLYFPNYNVLYLKKVEGNLKKVLDLQVS